MVRAIKNTLSLPISSTRGHNLDVMIDQSQEAPKIEKKIYNR
jgi:hypothetical protein